MAFLVRLQFEHCRESYASRPACNASCFSVCIFEEGEEKRKTMGKDRTTESLRAEPYSGLSHHETMMLCGWTISEPLARKPFQYFNLKSTIANDFY